MVQHDEVQLNLLRLLDGELPAAQAAAARRHLADCPDCARKVAVLEQAWKAAREAGRVEPPPFLHARIAARIREYERNRHFLSDLTESLWRVAQRVVLVLLVAGAVGVGIYLGGSPANPAGKSAQGGPSYLDSFADLPPQSVGGVYATLVGTSQ
jgi:anti-sigma factor RsiW